VTGKQLTFSSSSPSTKACHTSLRFCFTVKSNTIYHPYKNLKS
jgi:hypothetical protein